MVYMGFTKFIYHILYIHVFETLLCGLSYVEEEIKNILILDIDDQNTTCVVASKGHPCCVFEPKSSRTSKCLT